MCVDLNAFYPSCEELRDTSLIGKPHAAIMTEEQEGNIITKGVVASSSYEARIIFESNISDSCDVLNMSSLNMSDMNAIQNVFLPFSLVED
jgi:nucleotidyltransferase/DNA polymerase involved in DNA repair